LRSIPFWRKLISNFWGSGIETGALSIFWFRHSFFSLKILLFLICLNSPIGGISLAESNSPHTYITILLTQARQQQLANHRYWHLLLHYRQNLFGGVTSEVDDPNFFLSSNGKIDPQAELEATIRAFFSEDLRGKSQQTSQCAFIARYHWLQEQLNWNPTFFTQESCNKFDAWLSELNPQGISLIFPSAYMNNPASMFGHSFLRIDQQGQTEHTRILAYTINYAAEVPPDAGIEFAYKGIFGGYKGYFMSPPYYLKVKEYRDIENRDIWEYRLNFSEKEVVQLLRHVWELGEVYFDYFFFKENCAYHILSLLELANPNLHLTDQFILWTVPADTIRLVTQQPQLVKEVTYRPSHHTQIKRKRERLPSAQLALLNQVIQDPSALNNSSFQNLEIEQKAFLLDLALDYLQYKRTTDKEQAQSRKETNNKLLLTRSTLGVKSPPFSILPFSTPPETGHKTSRVGLGAGWRQDEFFEEFSIRAGYHDLLDPEPGYTPDAQIILGSATLRHYEKREQFRLENFTLADVVSLAPIDGLFKTPSWKFKIGMETIRFKGCKLCSNGNMNAGIGASMETQLFKREVYFVFTELDANASGAYEKNYRVGGGVSGGVMANVTDNWKWLISGGYLGYPLGDHSDDVHISVGQRFTLAENFALRTTFTHHDRDNEILAVFHGYF